MPRYFGFSIDDKREIASLIEQGRGHRFLMDRYCVTRSTAQRWIRQYKAIGLDGLLNMGSTHKSYSYETKLAAVTAFIDEGIPYVEIMSMYGIVNETRLRAWVRAYREDGPEALRPKPKGRPKGSTSKPKEQTNELERLRTENERLRCELEVQKRLNALALRKRRQGVKKPR